MTPEQRVIWEELVRDIPRLRAQIRALGVPAAHVDDVLQEVLIRVAQGLPKYDGRVPIGAYAFGFAVFTVRNWKQRQASKARALEKLRQEPHENREPPPDAATHARETNAQVHAALDMLSFNHRTVLVAVDMEGMRISELARVLGIPEETLRSRYKQARKLFAAAYARVTGRKP